MSTLVVVGYANPFKADEVLLKLRELQREDLLDLEDAAVAIKDQQGKVKLHHTVNLTANGCCRWRLLGIAHEPDLPAITCELADVGINDDFMKKSAATMTPGSSTLFVLDALTLLLTSTKQFRSSNVRCGKLVGGAGEVQTSTRI
jgi:uncharacterized membrane protein